MKHQALTAIFAIFLLSAGAAFAASNMIINSGSVDFQADGSGVLTVSGPEGFYHRQAFDAGEASLSLFDAEGDVLADGSYSWQISLDGKAPEDRNAFVASAESLSGSFTIKGGAVADPNAIESFEKAQVFTTDLIVEGSACVGVDCSSSESFGFDTFRLKENNLRIHFDDTSGSASFPNNDWRLTANDSSNGGANRFSIEDVTAGRVPFTVEAGAQANSVYVDDSGKVGFGTATPAVQLHHVDGNSPTLRLDQDGSDGFASQVWDLSGNEANFFIRDVTNGSKLPFRIKPGAPTDAMFIAASGDVGIGTDSPGEELHVKRAGSGNAALALETTGGTTPNSWIIRNQNSVGQLQFRDDTAGTIPMRIAPGANSDLIQMGVNAANRVDITGVLYINGVDNSTPDYVFADNYELETIEEHAEFMWTNKHLPSVAKAEVGADGKAMFNMATRSQGVLEELEKAHIYIEQLHSTMKQLSERLEQLEADK